jgi:methane/ammonia monooxygenase subunit C
MGANIFLWFWDYKFAFTAGLNSASHEFTLYYRTLFWGELIVLGIFTGIWYGWLIRTGRQLAGQSFSRAEEVRRIAVLWSIIGVTSLSIYIEASFWPNWDGAWHQTWSATRR